MRRDKWESNVEQGRKYAARMRADIERRLGRPIQTVLEIGCGSGFMGVGFQDIGCSYTGIDVDTESIAFGQAQGLDVHCISAEDMAQSELAEKKIDFVFSSNTFEHVESPLKAFDLLRQVVGGLGVVIVPNAEGLLPRLKANKMARYLSQRYLKNDRVVVHSIDGYWHNIAYTNGALRYLAEEEGLVVEDLYSISVNDSTYGFVQPTESKIYDFLSCIAKIWDIQSQLLIMVRPQ